YDIVCNGNEIGGGSVRIHRADVQRRVFELIGISPEEAAEKFGFLLEAFKYGPPPHAGIAFGWDRVCMLLAGADSIRDVIAFPKTRGGLDPLTGAPTPITDEQRREAGVDAKPKAASPAAGTAGVAGAGKPSYAPPPPTALVPRSERAALCEVPRPGPPGRGPRAVARSVSARCRCPMAGRYCLSGGARRSVLARRPRAVRGGRRSGGLRHSGPGRSAAGADASGFARRVGRPGSSPRPRGAAAATGDRGRPDAGDPPGAAGLR